MPRRAAGISMLAGPVGIRVCTAPDSWGKVCGYLGKGRGGRMIKKWEGGSSHLSTLLDPIASINPLQFSAPFLAWTQALGRPS